MTDQSRMPVTALLGANMFFSGVTYAATIPYASLVGVDTLGLSPALFATIMAVSSVLATFVSVGLGYISDKLPDRRLLVLMTALAGMVAHGTIFVWPTQASFAIAMGLIMPVAGACYSQCFGYVRVYYARHRPERADFMVTALRTVFTIAWIVVPPLAGWIAAEFNIFNVYLASALSYAAIAGIYAALMRDPATRIEASAPRRLEGGDWRSSFALQPGILAGLIGLVVMTGGSRLFTFTIPLSIVTDLGGSLTDVGLYAGITAAIEVPSLLLLGYLGNRLSKETLLAGAGVVMAVFIGLASQIGTVTQLFWLLVLNGLGTAALMTISLSYVQEAIKDRVGLSTSLLDVVAIAANLLGATAFGVLAAGGDYRFALMVAAVLSVAGAIILALGNTGRLGARQKTAGARI
jgi:SET family sugar efflux transporter-like MFS transporter